MAKLREIAANYIAWNCPGCEAKHGVPVNAHPSGNGWHWNGSLDAPTVSPSILVNACEANPNVPVCHSFLSDGKIRFLADCTHKLAGQTVEIPEWK